MNTFNYTLNDRIETIIKNINMGIADTKVDQNNNAYAINDNKLSISFEVVIIILIILIIIGSWKLFQNYIKKQIINNSVQNS